MSSKPFLEMKAMYQRVISGAGFIIRNVDALVLRGSDCIDFLNRLSTNDLKGLSESQCRTTVLTNEKGKIIDIATIFYQGESHLLIVSLHNGQRIKNWLEKFIIMEDVVVDGVLTDVQLIACIGSQTNLALSDIMGIQEVPREDNFINIVFNNRNLISYKDTKWQMPVFYIFEPQNLKSTLLPEFMDTASVKGIIDIINLDVFEIMRVEQGVPIFGKEISEHINPLEARLNKFISFSKGCYIGQEVIARLDSYKKLQRQLTGFKYIESTTLPSNTGKVFCDNKEVGWTTSISWSFKLNQWIALGYLKTSLENDDVEFIENGSNEKYLLKAVDLPFEKI